MGDHQQRTDGPASKDVELTDEQRRIVAHEEGPAVVFAVAGSGKTTSMVHRIERLVREDVFPPEAILATSFSTATVSDLEEALQAWPHCRDVDTRTLHSLGHKLLREAPPGDRPLRPSPGRGSIDGADQETLTEAVRRARSRDVAYKDELDNLDRRDFLSYVGDCKGNLRYADLDGVDLPDSALALAEQAQAPDGFDFYLDLYQLFEEVRHEKGRLTYDDLLLGGWEALHRYPELRAEAEGWFACVIVDEFQDINRAQHEILDIVAAPERNYMVIGDDDQTIYEWRGADPSFILDFADTYDAETYRIQDNFRCRAPQIALANRIIEHNDQRVAKQLSLTKGFDGELAIASHASEVELARSVVQQVEQARNGGRKLSEITVLLRIYAQSAYIEHLLIQKEIPYDIAGSLPFYARNEVGVLLAYVRLAQWEAAALGDRGVDPPAGDELGDLLVKVANRAAEPRYIRHADVRDVGRRAAREGMTLQQALNDKAEAIPHYMADGMWDLANEIAWLSRRLKRSNPGEVLTELDDRIGYRKHLREASGFDETGEGRARNVTAFVDYAGYASSLNHLVSHIEELRRTRLQASRSGEALDIRTIHRAKGLEWPVVIIPHVNDGTIPFSRAFGDEGRVEEERRLMYVAVTRSKQDTHLHLLEEEPISRFLEQADHEATLEATRTVGDLLAQSPRSWSAQQTVNLLIQVHDLGLERYLERWWQPRRSRKRSLARAANTVIAQAKEEKVLDRLGIPEEKRRLWTEGLAPPGKLPPDGLGQPIEPLVPEPRTRPADPSSQEASSARGREQADVEAPEIIDELDMGVKVRHPEHGEGSVLENPARGGQLDVLVAFDDNVARRIDLRDGSLSLSAAGDGPGVDGDRRRAGVPSSTVYLGDGAGPSGWVSLPLQTIEERIVPVVKANERDEDEEGTIFLNFGKEVSLSGWTSVDASAVNEEIEPIVEEERLDR